MKKLFVHLSLLCLLAVLVVPMVACGPKEEPVEVEDTTATDTATAESTPATSTDMATDMGTDMSTDMGGTEPMGTSMEPPPAQ